MTVYVFDKDKNIRTPLAVNQVTELVHDENSHTLHACIDASVELFPGEFLGFGCVDGHFRLFAVDTAGHDDDKNVTDVTATDAIVSELQEIITEENQQLDVTLHEAIRALLPDGWTIQGEQPEQTEKSRAYFAPVWQMLKTFEQLYKWRIAAWYEFVDGVIGAKVIETMPDEGVFRGRILQSRKTASKVYVTTKGKPITRLYVLGPAQGSQDVQTNLTIADAEWSVDAGDPVDKPKGQKWVEDPEAVAMYGLHTGTVTITDADTADVLLEKGWEALQSMKQPSVTCDATIADLELIPGYSWAVIRLGDLIAIRLKTGQAVTARVIAIKRDYIRNWLTKITIGDKKDSITYQVSNLIASATHTFERLTIYQNRFHEDEALIQMNAEFIQLNADAIEANAQQIRLNTEELLAKADTVDLEAVTVRISAVETEILGLLRVDALEAAIADLDSLHVGGDVNVPGNITADGLWVNGLANLEGGIYASAIEAGNIVAADVDVNNITCTGLSINGDALQKVSLTVVTGIDVVTSLEGNITAVQPVTTQFYYFA